MELHSLSKASYNGKIGVVIGPSLKDPLRVQVRLEDKKAITIKAANLKRVAAPSDATNGEEFSSQVSLTPLGASLVDAHSFDYNQPAA